MTLMSDNQSPHLTMAEQGSAPSTPASGLGFVYEKTDKKLYFKDASGNETNLTNAGSVSTSVPTVVAVGTSASGTGSVSPGLPTGHQANDILVLLVQSDNQTVTAPSGYTQLGPVVGIGTAAASGGTRLSTFWKRDGGSESAPTVADSGDHTLAIIIAFRGCPSTGDPFLSAGQTRKTTASTTSTGAAGATCADNCLVVQAFATALNSGSAAYSGWTNADLTSVTEQIDVGSADGNGGGIGLATGSLANAGPFRATTATVTSTVDVGTCFYLLPSGYYTKGDKVDRQVFTTAAFGDTWTKPFGAKMMRRVAIGGGASGSAGRNAATAAGGGAGGGGAWKSDESSAIDLPATLTVTAGAGGSATANSDGASANGGSSSTVNDGSRNIMTAGGGSAGGVSASGSGGSGGNGGGVSTATTAPTPGFGSQIPGGGLGGTTGGQGSLGADFSGGGGGGGGTTQAGLAGGGSVRGGGGGGGGRSNTNFSAGGASINAALAGGATAGANGQDSPYPEFGGSGAAGGNSAAAAGHGGWPGGAGGGGGTGSGAQGGGAGGDGVVVITTWC